MGFLVTLVKTLIILWNILLNFYFIPMINYYYLFSLFLNITSVASMLAVLFSNKFLKKFTGIVILICGGALSILGLIAFIITLGVSVGINREFDVIIIAIFLTISIIKLITGMFLVYEAENAIMNQEMKEIMSEFKRVEVENRRECLV